MIEREHLHISARSKGSALLLGLVSDMTTMVTPKPAKNKESVLILQHHPKSGATAKTFTRH